ncbi:MAG: hypothetical protein QXN62_06845 [Candidatus Bathyarchaeia archaeon]|nr:hypothetical protein [Candidatus Bathyarchaeota archaeon]
MSELCIIYIHPLAAIVFQHALRKDLCWFDEFPEPNRFALEHNSGPAVSIHN